MIMMEIQTNLCNKCMSTVLMLTLLDPTLAFVCYYTWAKTHEPWEYDYSIAFCTKLRHSISYTSITIIMKSISQQTQNDIISLLEQGKSCRQIAQEIGVHYSTVSKFHSKLNFTPPKGKGGCPSKLTPTAICCHGTTSLPLLHPPPAASNPICLHSTPTPKHTCATCAAMPCPLSD